MQKEMIQWFNLEAAQKEKFSSKDFFSKCDQIRSFLRIWSHLLKKSFMENFIFCAVRLQEYKGVNTIWKIVFEFMFNQMTKTKP